MSRGVRAAITFDKSSIIGCFIIPEEARGPRKERTEVAGINDRIGVGKRVFGTSVQRRTLETLILTAFDRIYQYKFLRHGASAFAWSWLREPMSFPSSVVVNR
jgi:hypothetical protein